MQKFVKQDVGQAGCLALLELGVLQYLDICPNSTIIAIVLRILIYARESNCLL
jgi:hypothetical protein